ncbi:MAG: hypothetical protein IJH34_00260 [Romboutsia sp.]|nr:hypothetical protein [Romboutsia sp.]
MKLSDWGKNELERASKNCDEYTKLCYESALKAYESLLDDGHSGMSFSITRNILDRLMNDLPLTPITEEDFKDADKFNQSGIETYQCPRYSALFKNIKDGKILYSDVQRVVFYDIKGHTWGSGLAVILIDKKYPITLPYFPSVNKYKVHGWDCMYDDKNGIYEKPGSYNIQYFDYVITPECDKVKLDKLYLEDETGKMQEVKGKKKKKILKLYKKFINTNS